MPYCVILVSRMIYDLFHLVCLSLHLWRHACSLLTNFQSLFAKCEFYTVSTGWASPYQMSERKLTLGNSWYLIRTSRTSWCLKRSDDNGFERKHEIFCLFVCFFLSVHSLGIDIQWVIFNSKPNIKSSGQASVSYFITTHSIPFF